MKFLQSVLFFSVSLILNQFVCYGHSDTIPRRTYHATHIFENKPEVDGKLNDLCWKEYGRWSQNYIQQNPNEGGKPSERTSLKILYDDRYIYVGIKAYDNPLKIDRSSSNRDEYNGDMVGVAFDSYDDHRTAFEFDVNASGAKLDVLLNNTSIDLNWNAVWDGKVAIGDSGWTAEMRIPLNQLRYSSKAVQVWGLHSWRFINRLQEEDQWNLIPRNNSDPVYYFGKLVGLNNLKKSRHVEILPYVLSQLATDEKQAGNPFATGNTFSTTIGLDGKIGVTSDMTLDATINPDFGQVEADPSVMNLTAFETFYSEKRPFFLEGKNILEYNSGNEQLFYSRRIGKAPGYIPDIPDTAYLKSPDKTRILGAVKLTGKTQNGWSVGAMESFTSSEYAKIKNGSQESKPLVEPYTNYFVGRVQKDFHKGNTVIGGILTSVRRFTSDSVIRSKLVESAYSGGVDWVHYWHHRDYFFDGKTYMSSLNGSKASITNLQQTSAHYFQRPDAGYLHVDSSLSRMQGTGGLFSFGRGGNNKLKITETMGWLSPRLELNDIGYMQKADNLNQTANVTFNQTDPHWIFRSYNFIFQYQNIWDFGGTLTQNNCLFDANGQLKNNYGVELMAERYFAAPNTWILRGGPYLEIPGDSRFKIVMSTNYSRLIAGYVALQRNFSDDGISNYKGVFPGFMIKLFHKINISTDIGYSVQRDDNQYVTTDTLGANDLRYIMARLDQKTVGITFRLNYNINPELSVQYYGSPFISIGKYSGFKKAQDFRKLNPNQRYVLYKKSEISYSATDNTFGVAEQNTGLTYNFDNPDFSFREFKSNLVIRWEYRPGSQLYLVWTHQRSASQSSYDSSIRHNYASMFRIFPQNVFLLKFNYWFSI